MIFSRKWPSKRIFFLAKQVHHEVELFKIYWNARKLEGKIDDNLALLGEAMFRQREQAICPMAEDTSVILLTERIREDQKILSNINKQNNSYLLNIYNSIYKLFIKL